MGLKSGSRDAGLDDSDDEEEQKEIEELDGNESTDAKAERQHQTSIEETGTAEATDTTAQTGGSEQRPTMESIPYKLRRDKVNEGREQVPYFLREKVIEAESELQDTLEELLGENVYKSDYREAAMVVAQRNPELVAAVLREWGYDLETA